MVNESGVPQDLGLFDVAFSEATGTSTTAPATLAISSPAPTRARSTTRCHHLGHVSRVNLQLDHQLHRQHHLGRRQCGSCGFHQRRRRRRRRTQRPELGNRQRVCRATSTTTARSMPPTTSCGERPSTNPAATTSGGRTSGGLPIRPRRPERRRSRAGCDSTLASHAIHWPGIGTNEIAIAFR